MAISLEKTLKKRLEGCRRLAVLGVGSELRGDDAAGMLLCALLKKSPSRKMKVFPGSTAPENLTGQIRKFRPSHLLIVDCFEGIGSPGQVKLIETEKVTGFSASTHRLPITLMTEYLSSCLECRIILLGVQPKSLGFLHPVSRQVEKSVQGLCRAIRRAFPH